MTFASFILSIVLIIGGLFGIFAAFNTLHNWTAYGGDHNKYHRDIAYIGFVASFVFFHMGLWGLFPTWLALILSVVSTAFLVLFFWDGGDETIRKLWDPGKDEREAQASLLEKQHTTNLALDKVEDVLETYIPAPGPFQVQYFDIAPYSEYVPILKHTAGTGLAGYVVVGKERKATTFREESAIWAPELKELFSKKVSMGFSDEQRFRHQFIVGATGSGKTTLLSAQINEDLDRVARNEASLFVMDSQNELIPDIARLARFAPGGDLHGKLIYIEYDPDHPLSLNIFDFNRERIAALSSRERVTLMRSAEEMIGFFMQSFVKAETSGFMEAIVRYILRAVMHVPNPTVFTFKDFLSKDGFAKHAEHLATLSDNDRRFLTADMFDGSYGASLGAMRARLAAMTSDDLFNSMFTHPRNKFDLFTLLQDSKVILVNTTKGVLKKATEPFGRYFIARLMQATEERMLIPRASRLPVFAYIDEAGDYISDEQNIAELIDKARKQKIALTLAIQRTGDIANANVLDALRRAAIQCWGRVQPKWNIAIDGAEPIEITVPNVDFGGMNRMSEAQFQTILTDMRKRFSVSAEVTSPPSAPVQRARPGPAPVTEPDDDFPTGPAKY